MNPWEVLGLSQAEAADPAAVKRAYARLLKVHRPDRDPEGFRRIRDAYEALLGGTAGTPTGSASASRPAPPAGAATPARAPAAASASTASRPEAPPATAGRASPSPLDLLRRGDWNALGELATARLDAAAAADPGLDLDLARCFALVQPAMAVELAQRAFQADRAAVDPGMEHLLSAGLDLAGYSVADRRLASAAVLGVLSEGDDPPTARRLRTMGYQVAHAGLRTELVAAASRLDRSGERRLALMNEQSTALDRSRRRNARILMGLAAAVAIILALLVARCPGQEGPILPPLPRPPLPGSPPPMPAKPVQPPQDAAPQPPRDLEVAITDRCREELNRGQPALAAMLFRASGKSNAQREQALDAALYDLLTDASIPEEQRVRFARIVYRNGPPALRQTISTIMPQAVPADAGK